MLQNEVFCLVNSFKTGWTFAARNIHVEPTPSSASHTSDTQIEKLYCLKLPPHLCSTDICDCSTL